MPMIDDEHMEADGKFRQQIKRAGITTPMIRAGLEAMRDMDRNPDVTYTDTQWVVAIYAAMKEAAE